MDADAKKRVLRAAPYGLYAACTRSADGEHHVFLLSWMTQASFDPPLVVCCIHAESTSHGHLLDAEPAVMTVNVLGEDQMELATELLKGPAFDESTVAGETFELGENGCAVLPSTLGALELSVIERVVKGDHTVFVCEVTQAHHYRDGAVLTHAITGWKYAG